jgi:starch phosphorylase
MSATRFPLEINPHLPQRLERLDDLANNLWYSWDGPTRALFARLGPRLWDACGHCPKAALKRINQRNLDQAAEDPAFLGALARVLSAYDTYHTAPAREHGPHLPDKALIAYFCAEFGFHESLPIYSGGLGILAGDHCKTASDLNLPFVGLGLLYRQGYFTQHIDARGQQTAQYRDTDFDDLPIFPVLRPDGSPLIVPVPFPGRDVLAKVWQVRVGKITLYLLDTALSENSPHDRDITHRLYGGDRTTRIEQELLLGIGGVRALSAMGVSPTVWHINEGHAAFLILERIREKVGAGLDFMSALEATASNTVFTTHTVVPAGHDHFSPEMMRHYFSALSPQLGCDMSTLLSLGKMPNSEEFNMTALAIRGSRFHNGVSRIHGEVSAQAFAHLWPQIEPQDNPINHVTNGVHLPTFLSDLWLETFTHTLGADWTQRLTDPQCWERIGAIADHAFWSIRQSIKTQLLHLIGNRLTHQHTRNQYSQAHLDRLLRLANPENPNVLTIGFARRFATYKRAALLFHDLDALREIITDPERPVLLIFGGKAHPADEPGQAIIQRIAEVAAMPEFLGHIVLLENFDLHLSRRLVAGVDVWLNNPVYPLEASGTSGMKAAMNGVLNLSVLDGWWAEVCDDRPGHENGWGIKPVNTSGAIDDPQRDAEEARALYEILQDKVLPLYYDRGPMGYSAGWVAASKRAIATIVPHFSSQRMLTEYLGKYYIPAARQAQRFCSDQFKGAKTLAAWKLKIRQAWNQVSLRALGGPPVRLTYGAPLTFELAAFLGPLDIQDVRIELLLGRPNAPSAATARVHAFVHSGTLDTGEHRFTLTITPDLCGKVEYRIRMYPTHALLTHPFEMGMMTWL